MVNPFREEQLMSNQMLPEDKCAISAEKQEEADAIVTNLEKLCGSVKESLQDSQERFQIAIEHMCEWEYWIGADGRYIFVSPACKRITGYAPEEFQNDPDLFLQIVHPEDRALVTSHLDEENSSDDVSPIRFRIVTGEIEERWIAHVCHRVYSSTGELLGVRASNRDITEQVRTEAQRREFEERIQRSAEKVESLGTLASSVANDFNNLVHAIIGNAELALGGLQSVAATPEPVKELDKGPNRASASSRRFLSEPVEESSVVQQLNINSLIEEMRDELNSFVPPHIELIHSLAADVPLIEADKQQIRQVILSLAAIASDAIGANRGQVMLVTGSTYCDQGYLGLFNLDQKLKEGRHVYFEISDDRSEMDNTTIQETDDSSLSTEVFSEALGLPAISEVVGKYNGAVKVESGPGEGTLFRILFPVSQQKAIEEKAKPDGVIECGLEHKGTVLLVDDEQFILAMVKDMLELVNFEVITAQDGQQAVDLFGEHKNEITCILLDLNMPGKNGKETFEELQQIKAEVPVIITSGSTETEVRKQFGGTVPGEFLQKPYHYSTLVGKVNELTASNQN